MRIEMVCEKEIAVEPKKKKEIDKQHQLASNEVKSSLNTSLTREQQETVEKYRRLARLYTKRYVNLYAIICNKNYSDTLSEFNELYQEACRAIIQSVLKFNEQKGVNLETYISESIERNILAFLRRENTHFKHKGFSLDEPKYEHDEDGNSLTTHDILDVKKAYKYTQKTVLDKITQEELAYIINKLEPIERKVIIEYFYNNKSYEQIGKENYYSKTEVSRKINKSLTKIKQIYLNGKITNHKINPNSKQFQKNKFKRTKHNSLNQTEKDNLKQISHFIFDSNTAQIIIEYYINNKPLNEISNEINFSMSKIHRIKQNAIKTINENQEQYPKLITTSLCEKLNR